MSAYLQLTAAGVTTRSAADLTGIARATAARVVAATRAGPADPVPRVGEGVSDGLCTEFLQ